LSQPELATARIERVLPAVPEVVYDAWLDENAMRQFMCPHPGHVSEVTVDPRLGGSLRVVMSLPDHEREITGNFIALDRPQRVCFTWNTDVDEHESIVTVLLAPQGNDETHMTIIHTRQLASLVPSYINGWTSIADALADHLGG
jgi:uncharacterized protein YndB with AHSA1/START domain